MDTVLHWLTDNAAVIVALLAGLHGVAVIIINLTPTPADDRILGKFYKLLEKLAGLISKKAKEPPG